jgi:hypothetical protein
MTSLMTRLCRHSLIVGLVSLLLAQGTLGAQAQKPSAPPVTADTVVYVTKTGTKYHLETCRTLRASKIPMKLGEAVKKYGACAVCNPPRLTGTAGVATSGASSGTAPTTASAPAAPTSRQCAAITKKGTRCTRMAKPGSAYCWQHGG